ncbi:DUF4871 domain-containing protein [Bacillus cereus]
MYYRTKARISNSNTRTLSKETSKPNWTTSNTIDSTTHELPLTMSLPSSGLWVLNIYVNEKYYDQFVITAE